MLTFLLFRVMIDIGMVRFVSEGIQNRIQNDYFGGAISGQKKCYISAPFLEGPIWKLPTLAQYSADTLRIQYHTTDLSNPPRLLFGNDLSLLLPCHSNHMPTRVQEDTRALQY